MNCPNDHVSSPVQQSPTGGSDNLFLPTNMHARLVSQWTTRLLTHARPIPTADIMNDRLGDYIYTLFVAGTLVVFRPPIRLPGENNIVTTAQLT